MVNRNLIKDKSFPEGTILSWTEKKKKLPLRWRERERERNRKKGYVEFSMRFHPVKSIESGIIGLSTVV